MSTEEIVEELMQRFNGFNADGSHGVLRYINTANKILASIECERNLLLGSDGLLPAVNTTAGTYTYTMPATVWRVSEICILIDDYTLSNVADYGQFLVRPTRSTFPNTVSIGGRLYASYPYARSVRDYMSSSLLSQVIFSRDPGTTTDYFRRRSYKRPTEITSTGIESDFPPPLDMEILLPAAAKLIEGAQSGNYMEAYAYVSGEFKRDFWKQQNAGEAGAYDMEPVDRGF